MSEILKRLQSVDLTAYIDVYQGILTNGLQPRSLVAWQATHSFQDAFHAVQGSHTDVLLDAIEGAKDIFLKSQYQKYTRMIRTSPEKVTIWIRQLHNEKTKLSERCITFRQNICQHTGSASLYSDYRIISKLLALRYPHRYFLYNSRAFKHLLWLVQLEMQLDDTCYDHYRLYNDMCSHIRQVLMGNEKLMECYARSNAHDVYADASCHLLTQDFVYQMCKMDTINTEIQKRRNMMDLAPTQADNVVASGNSKTPRARKTYDDRNHMLGRKGEEWVMKYEQEKLIGTKYARRVRHVALEDESLGYDIESYTPEGEKMYIEVKTTGKGLGAMFNITHKELEVSRKKGSKYYLYRLSNFDTVQKQLKIIQGDLSPLCESSVKYGICIEESDTIE